MRNTTAQSATESRGKPTVLQFKRHHDRGSGQGEEPAQGCASGLGKVGFQKNRLNQRCDSINSKPGYFQQRYLVYGPETQ